MIDLILPDGSKKTTESDKLWIDFIKEEIGEGLARNSVAVEINGEKQDLFQKVSAGNLKVITLNSEEGLEILRHSTAHILADAVLQLFPGTKLTIGPAIENGFYYDFDSEHRFSEDDFEAIEKKMKEIIKAKLPFKKTTMSKEEAIKKFKETNDTYKIELAEAIEDDTVSFYSHGDFSDLCKGPHLPNTGYVKAFKILSIAGAYWRGDEHNKMLQRFYGTAFPKKKDLNEYLEMLEEAKKRDHRKIGKALDLYEISEVVGGGLVLWTPKGGKIRSIIENFWKKEHYKNGYDVVYTPHIGRSNLWETSGHLGFYKDGMYSSMDIDGEDYYVKPMNCPFHITLYKRKKWSYRDFPIRWAELGTVYRYEKSGTLNGLKRVRGFTQDDAHIFCRADQIEEEIENTLNFSFHMLENFGFEDFELYLSTRPEKYVGDLESWNKAEKALENALKKSGKKFSINEADGAFYGPKIDINVKDSIGRAWQLSTIQVDFQLPQRFEMTYVGDDAKDHRPIMLHRALLGSLERFFAILTEHYAGAFPVWLSPVQVALLPVADRHLETAKRLESQLRQKNIRVSIDSRSEKIGYKIREQVMEKIPYIVVLGDNDKDLEKITVRIRGGEQKEFLTKEFVELVNKENREGLYF